MEVVTSYAVFKKIVTDVTTYISVENSKVESLKYKRIW
jgi:hypothetical protein